ncbi:hypothetical protein HII31_09717 [Pseudocercospora fuligena]|uniref:Uncharacterized protein n=1 Tax=Pseudocercospora fuligena TaxID=685502 RepID=A0A8H6RD76_9PEZI|nr:hypothetical protein HII31_09717 [Pseudocercospora fuligena]
MLFNPIQTPCDGFGSGSVKEQPSTHRRDKLQSVVKEDLPDRNKVVRALAGLQTQRLASNASQRAFSRFLLSEAMRTEAKHGMRHCLEPLFHEQCYQSWRRFRGGRGEKSKKAGTSGTEILARRNDTRERHLQGCELVGSFRPFLVHNDEPLRQLHYAQASKPDCMPLFCRPMVPVDSFPISGSAVNRARGSSTPLRFVLSHRDRVLLLSWNTLATAAGRRRRGEPWMRLGPRNLRSAVDKGSSKEEGFLIELGRGAWRWHVSTCPHRPSSESCGVMSMPHVA